MLLIGNCLPFYNDVTLVLLVVFIVVVIVTANMCAKSRMKFIRL